MDPEGWPLSSPLASQTNAAGRARQRVDISLQTWRSQLPSAGLHCKVAGITGSHLTKDKKLKIRCVCGGGVPTGNSASGRETQCPWKELRRWSGWEGCFIYFLKSGCGNWDPSWAGWVMQEGHMVMILGMACKGKEQHRARSHPGTPERGLEVLGTALSWEEAGWPGVPVSALLLGEEAGYHRAGARVSCHQAKPHTACSSPLIMWIPKTRRELLLEEEDGVRCISTYKFSSAITWQ